MKKVQIELGKQDKEIFNFLYLNKVATTKQIGTHCLKESKRSTVSWRLKRLEDAGYLKKIPTLLNNHLAAAYSVSDKCFEEIFMNQFIVGMRKQFKSASVEHDLVLVDIQNKIRSLPFCSNYFTENALQSGSEIISQLQLNDFIELRSDAVAVLKDGDEKHFVPIEYEASFKYLSRYRDKLFDYYTRHNIGTVLFVCESDELLHSIVNAEIMSCSNFKPKLYYCTLKNLLAPSSKMSFFNRENEFFDMGLSLDDH